MEKQYRVLLYYKYVPIEDPEAFREQHLAFCKELGLLGRILVSSEGINGTVSGTVEQTEKYMETMKADPRFADMVFKIDEAEGHAFKKIFVRHKKELVTLRLEDDVDPNETTGQHLKPAEFYEKMQDPNTIVIDARNDYEYDLGHFRGAVRPDIEAFRELPEWIEEHKDMLEGKKILTYCTGGVRCEKFSGWLVKQGFEDVAQLDGGIVTYGKDPEVQGKLASQTVFGNCHFSLFHVLCIVRNGVRRRLIQQHLGDGLSHRPVDCDGCCCGIYPVWRLFGSQLDRFCSGDYYVCRTHSCADRYVFPHGRSR